MSSKVRQCYVTFIGNPYWTDPRPNFKTNFEEIHERARNALDSCGFAEKTGLDWIVTTIEVAFFNPPNPGPVSTNIRTVKKDRIASVKWYIFPRNLPDDEETWVSVYIALFVDSIEQLLHKFKIATADLQPLKAMSPRQIDLVQHFAGESYTPWPREAKRSKSKPKNSPPRPQCPELIAIDHDDYHAQHVGRTSDGRQFFLTTPFIPAIDDAGNEFLALYLFDDAGNLLDAQIDEFGGRATMDIDAAFALKDKRLAELGTVTFERILVKPFCVERFGTSFGLIPVCQDDEVGSWSVELQPGDYMAFHEPWDSGKYDT